MPLIMAFVKNFASQSMRPVKDMSSRTTPKIIPAAAMIGREIGLLSYIHNLSCRRMSRGERQKISMGKK